MLAKLALIWASVSSPIHSTFSAAYWSFSAIFISQLKYFITNSNKYGENVSSYLSLSSSLLQ
jgi:hypothetical protein